MASNVESTSNAAHSSVSFAVGEKFSCFTDFHKKQSMKGTMLCNSLVVIPEHWKQLLNVYQKEC